jgi:putative ATP-dependent endonuclease of OLD family
MGRILQDVNDRFSKEEIINEETGEVINKSEDFKNKLIKLRDEYLFSVIDEDGENIMQKFVDVLQKETAQQLNKPEDEFKVDLNLYDPWNFYRTLQLSVFERDMNLDFRARS